MTFTALLYALLAAALAAGFAYLFSGLLQGLLDLRQRPYWVVPVAGIGAAAITLSVLWLGEPRDELPLTAARGSASGTPDGQAPSDPTVYIEGLKADDPALYRKVKASLQSDLARGKGETVALANARDLLDDYIEQKLPFLPDEVIVERFQLLRDVLSYLGAQNQNEICAGLALGTKRSGVQLYLSSELVARDTASVTHIVAAARDEAAVKLPMEEFKNLTNAAFAHSAESAGIALEEVDSLLTGTGDPKKTCMLMIGFFDAVVSLSPSQAASALRTMAVGEQSPVPADVQPPPPPLPAQPPPPASVPAPPATPPAAATPQQH